MKILLIDLSDYFIYKTDAKQLRMISIPLGLISLASYIMEYIDIDCRIIKSGIDYFSEEDVINIINEEKPDYIGIRALSISSNELYRLSKQIKYIYPDIFMIIGGPHASSSPEETLDNTDADAIIVGEGEEILLELLIKRNLYGILKQDSTPITLDKLPIPDYNLIDINKYAKVINWASMKRKNVLIESSRGCPFGCVYCHNLFGRMIRFKSAKRVFEEVKSIYDTFKVRDFFFVDDAFNLDYDRGIKLFNMIIESDLDINIHFTNGLRGDRLDKEFIDKMIDAGAISIDYAVETASPRLQRYINKNLKLDKLRKNIRYTCNKGVMVRLFFMFGFPTETQDEVKMTLSFMKEFKKCIPMFYAVKYYKNTKLYNLALEEGFSIKELEKVGKGSYHQIEFCRTPLLDSSFMRMVFYRYMQEILLNKERIQNIIDIQRNYLTEEEIKIFFSSFFMKDIDSIDNLLGICK